MKNVFVIIAAISITGCSHLMIYENDNALKYGTKTVARIALLCSAVLLVCLKSISVTWR